MTRHALMRDRIDALEAILAAQLEDYGKLLELVDRKSEAIRHARIECIAELFECEKVIVQHVGDCERRRMELIHEISQSIDPGLKKPLRVTQIAEAQSDENIRSRLLDTAERLRAVASEVKNRSSTVRAAAEALARHMSGVMQSVQSALSRAGVYEHKGRLAVGAQIDFSVDVRS